MVKIKNSMSQESPRKKQIAKFCTRRENGKTKNRGTTGNYTENNEKEKCLEQKQQNGNKKEVICGYTFQIWKLTGSTTVGCMISMPGKTPQVTAIGW
jgi:hypothetical protein